MARFKCSLDNVRIASPCNVDWDSMVGNERRRFCDQCQLNVYNLSEMTRSEAERFVGSSEGRVCIRYYQRRDGSIITRNCPIGLQAVKRRLSRVRNAVVSLVVTFLAGIGAYQLVHLLRYRQQPVGLTGVIAVQPQPVIITREPPRVMVGDLEPIQGKPMYTPRRPKRQ